jgi:hypothetical protein
MNFKTETLYVQRKTLKRLWMVLSLYPSTHDTFTGRCRSAGDLADALINDQIDSRYPEVKICEREKGKLEQQVALRIRTELPKTSPVSSPENDQRDS